MMCLMVVCCFLESFCMLMLMVFRWGVVGVVVVVEVFFLNLFIS